MWGVRVGIGYLMDENEYKAKFGIEKYPDDKKNPDLEKALDLALDIRKFEIDLYWKRATYFWTFIAAAFAGYALVYKSSIADNSWLLLLFSSLGFLFSVSWYLVNRGSKFWQNNWERHVDLLEDKVVGPLYKIIAENPNNKNILTSSAQFSVSKINQILSFYISLFWLLLMVKSILPVTPSFPPDWFKVGILSVTVIAFVSLLKFGKSENKKTTTKLSERGIKIEP